MRKAQLEVRSDQRSDAVSAGPRAVIIGAGIVGCALADELTARGWTNVTVLDQGPPARPGGSTGHAPGLVFQTSPSKTMTEFARYTTAKYAGLSVDGEPCLHQVGGLELATTPERWPDLQRRHGWATSWGVPAFLRSAGECARLHPLIDPDRILGGFHIPGDGLARPVLAAAAQANRAAARGATFRPGQRVTGIRQAGGRVTGVLTGTGEVPADVVVCCAGIWGPLIGALVDLAIPLVPMAHQYARTTPLPALSGRGPDPDAATAPILRHQGAGLYFREHGPRIGIGAYGHRPMPVAPAEIGRTAEQPFTPLDFEESWTAAADLLPALGEAKVADGINGLFSFTPDGNPLLGEHPGLRGFWAAEAVWITHSAGVAKALAEWLVQGQPSVAVQACDLSRFEEAQLAPGYVHTRSCQAFAEVYDIVHPQQPPGPPRPVRAMTYFRARRACIGDVPVTALRLSYVGELGWELYTGADTGQRLWDTLWEAGRPHGMIAAGRGAFSSLRLEKGYRLWGADMTAEHDPYEAGLGFAVGLDKGDFVGRDALVQRSGRTPARRLTCLVTGDPARVMMGSEPVYAGGTPAGYVTSAAYGYSIGASIAYAWLPAAVAAPGNAVEIGYFGERVPAVVAAEPLFDPAMTRLRA